MTTRAEHVAWCKKRALEYVDRNDLSNAVTSMLSDLGKHSETAVSPSNSVLASLGMMYVMDRDTAGVRRWVEGFN